MATPIATEEEPFISQFRALIAKFEEADRHLSSFFAHSMAFLRSSDRSFGSRQPKVNPAECETMNRQLETYKSIYFDYTQANVMNDEEKKQKHANRLVKLIKQMEHVLHWSTLVNPQNVDDYAGYDESKGTAAFGAIFGASPKDLWGTE
eukprot:TRINITY_DN9144_c0_g1_i1.p1 TRINITY_DN9144_c0_g1~~TRINITY_DN9144_c0_g1_i1.p1  ORF type:complete len:149 (-),score=27.75 TRINITY_DN9144_c0_g1_i1:24-470(-)